MSNIICMEHSVRRAGIPAGCRWAWFAGDDLNNSRAHLPADGEIDYTPQLRAIARELKQPYLDLLDALARKQPETEWLCSSISERFPASPVFADCCRLVLAARHAQAWRGDGTLLLICESAGLARALHRALPGSQLQGVAIPVITPGWLLRMVWHRFRVALTRQQALPLPLPAPLLLRTWLDDRTVAEGAYRDTYLGDLPRQLQETGQPFAVLGEILEEKTRERLAAGVRGMPPLIDTAAVLSRIDRVRIWWRDLTQRRLRFSRALLAGVDVAPLLQSVADNERWSARVAFFLCEEYVVTALARRGWRPQRIVYPCENLASEKIFCRAVRRFWPDCELVGHAHTITSPMYLMYTPLPTERDALPHRLLTVGDVSRDYLYRQGWLRVETGAALRYAHLFRPLPQRTAGTARTVLVPLPLMPRDARQFCRQVREGLGGAPGISVLVKPHPRLTGPGVERMLEELTAGTLHISVTRQPVAELLDTVDLVLCADSTVALEALARGVPVAHLRLRYDIDCDGLEEYPEMQAVIDDPAELLNREWCCAPGTAEFVRRYWTPPTAATLARFAGAAC